MEFTYKGHSIIEILGRPKESVESALKQVVSALNGSDFLKASEIEVSDVINAKDTKTMFTGFLEFDIEFKTYDDIFGYLIDFMPSSLEINEPAELKFDLASFNNMVSDIIARLHEYDKIVKDKVTETVFLEKKMDLLIRNLIMVIVSDKKLPADQIAARSGIDSNSIRDWLNSMVRNDILKTDGHNFMLAENANEIASKSDNPEPPVNPVPSGSEETQNNKEDN